MKRNRIRTDFRLPPELVDRLLTYCGETGLSRTAVIVRALKEYLSAPSVVSVNSSESGESIAADLAGEAVSEAKREAGGSNEPVKRRRGRPRLGSIPA